ncbi:peroxiredoxin [Hamadaea flava]|uniref:Redoxin domain-containing protein n=1 Tax=Hamadaea flava TaxID=1742688 RepID=A0ABV8LF20_9ACTN|nr:TlpA disulfide reductase family protein [Hamadaea flava]MCP2326242.1 peroxiredoxin [Hamadaea flava]
MRRWAVTVLAGALLLAGCGSDEPKNAEPPIDGPFAECAALSSDNASPELPDVTLPCFHGGQSVRFSQLKGAVVVNLWASWCQPCIRELPAFTQLAGKKDAPRVIGVVTTDKRNSSAALAEELHVTFPTLFDDRGRLATALVEAERIKSSALPATVFVKDGRIAYVYQGSALDEAKLTELVDRYLGVKV